MWPEHFFEIVAQIIEKIMQKFIKKFDFFPMLAEVGSIYLKFSFIIPTLILTFY